MQLKTTTTPYGGFGECYHFIADRLPAQVRDSTLTVVAGVWSTVLGVWPTVLQCPAVGRPRVDGPLSHTPPGEGRSEERRREGGSGGENTTLLTSIEGKLAVSKRQLESFKTSKFSTRDTASIQAHSVLQSTATPLRSHTHRHTQCCTLRFRGGRSINSI